MMLLSRTEGLSQIYENAQRHQPRGLGQGRREALTAASDSDRGSVSQLRNRLGPRWLAGRPRRHRDGMPRASATQVHGQGKRRKGCINATLREVSKHACCVVS